MSRDSLSDQLEQHAITREVAADARADQEEIKHLRAALVKFVEHFGPLEDNHMLHEDARKCFKLARAALGSEEHDRAIKRAFNQ